VTRSSDSPGVLVFPPVLFLGTLAAGLVLHWLRPLPLLPSLVARLLGAAVLVLSWILARSAERAMRHAGTNIRPDQPTVALVTDGPFRRTRNPLYLAAIGFYLAVTLLVNAVWPLVLLPVLVAVLHWGVVRREERYLEEKFGEDYRDYRRRVRRWI
jgi:protein-S-isoprenylcysteine O-methyltransferase Ste14